jgi:cation diffusion facilitator CzcD-associated flavoprotein CzcO
MGAMTDTVVTPDNATESLAEDSTPGTRYVDVLIVGAGISGVGSAYHLKTQCPEKSFVVLEALDSFGGTWHMHRYPGIRSDSDLYTFGYRFKPWMGKPIATAAEILSYMGEVIEENDLDQYICYQHRITQASWSSADRLWTLEVTRTDTGETLRYTTPFLWMCQGYYRHAEGYTPEWPGMDQFTGQIVHPQTWPEDLDYEGKNVVVIGSGATAATLVPAIADKVGHVTMLQRSPTYFWTDRNANELVDQLRALEIPNEWIHEIARRKALTDQQMLTTFARTEPQMARDELMKNVAAHLPEGFDVEKHFGPHYRPWQQRLAFVPNGDLFEGIRSGKASVVTDQIASFTKTGIALESGDHLDADIIITATGFHLSVLGDIEFMIDGSPLDFADTITYRGMMFTGVPNMVWIFGYLRASWTLRADLIGDFVCRMLQHMDAKGAEVVVPELRPEDADMELLPWIDPEDFNSGYLMRSMHLMPKRGAKIEWQHTQDYWNEKDQLPMVDLEDGCLKFT